MNVKEMDFPEQFRPIIRRLKSTIEVREVRDVMELEDDFVKEIQEYEDRVKTAKSNLNDALQQNVVAFKLKDETINQKEEERRQKEKKRRQKESAVLLLLSNGVDKKQIAKKLGITKAEISKIKHHK